MITELDIKGFRCFEHLRVPGLTRVNLLVGNNNSGKTSVLEAVETVATGTVTALLRGPRRREELVDFREDDDNLGRRPVYRTDVSHIFWGHRLTPGTSFTITAEESVPTQPTVLKRMASCTVKQLVLEPSNPADALPDENDLRLVLSFQSDKLQNPIHVELSAAGGPAARLQLSQAEPEGAALPVKFTNVEIGGLARLWDEIALTSAQELVMNALRIVEERAEGLAFLSSLRLARQGAVLVKLAGEDRRLPLGSLGDGSKRLLALSLHLVNAADGVLLVDEIDTGLHHSAMTKMWRLVIETARRLDVQVLATTHSEDCVRSLAEAAELDAATSEDVSLHRIDPGEAETMRYSADDLIVATRGRIEVR